MGLPTTIINVLHDAVSDQFVMVSVTEWMPRSTKKCLSISSRHRSRHCRSSRTSFASTRRALMCTRRRWWKACWDCWRCVRRKWHISAKSCWSLQDTYWLPTSETVCQLLLNYYYYLLLLAIARLNWLTASFWSHSKYLQFDLIWYYYCYYDGKTTTVAAAAAVLTFTSMSAVTLKYTVSHKNVPLCFLL